MPKKNESSRMKRVQFSLPVEQHDAVREAAARYSVSISGFVRSAIRREVDGEHAVHQEVCHRKANSPKTCEQRYP